MKQILLIKTGGIIDLIKKDHGDFEDWFAEGMGVSNLLKVDVFRHESLPDPEKVSGVVITGSAFMVSEKENWSENTAKWLANAAAAGTPILGICYGHQLLAHALGGRAGPNPNGRQIGTVKIQLLDCATKDPLFCHLPQSFPSQTSHSEVVLDLPPGAQRLASSPLDDNFSIRFSEKVWGVQFHPEFSAPVMRKYIQFRSQAIRDEGLNPEKLLENVTDSDVSNSVLARFTELVSG